MNRLEIPIEWSGAFSLEEVIAEMTDEGDPPDYSGEDYGLYQIYGQHILCGADTLLYIGKATNQTFSLRFQQHGREWLHDEADVQIYLGRVYDPKRHSKSDDWDSWKWDVELAEKILIHKYSPHYNSTSISNPPVLEPFKNIRLIHTSNRHQLEKEDNAPKDW
ncbi:hypothetical protein IH992_07175 [Candidatus Poribacteria bacterium]|nr:hypothetical protein [Candidatus Poribacteria bacterium]